MPEVAAAIAPILEKAPVLGAIFKVCGEVSKLAEAYAESSKSCDRIRIRCANLKRTLLKCAKAFQNAGSVSLDDMGTLDELAVQLGRLKKLTIERTESWTVTRFFTASSWKEKYERVERYSFL